MTSQTKTQDTETESSAGIPETPHDEVAMELIAVIEALRQQVKNPTPFLGAVHA